MMENRASAGLLFILALILTSGLVAFPLLTQILEVPDSKIRGETVAFVTTQPAAAQEPTLLNTQKAEGYNVHHTTSPRAAVLSSQSSTPKYSGVGKVESPGKWTISERTPIPTPTPEVLKWVPSRLIYFVDLSHGKELHQHSVCGVISAILHNPNRTVVVLSNHIQQLSIAPNWTLVIKSSLVDMFKSMDERDDISLNLANPTKPIIFVVRFELAWILKDTLLYKWHFDHRNVGRFQTINLADGLRLVLLQKFGGSYYDLDMISLRPIPESFMQGSAAYETPGMLNNAALSFPPNSTFMNEAMVEFVFGFKRDLWAHNGPRVIDRLYQRYAKEHPNDQKALDQYLLALPQETFYPMTFMPDDFMPKIAQSTSDFDMYEQWPKSVAVHLYNSAIKLYRFKLWNGDSLIARTMKKACPGVNLVFSPGFPVFCVKNEC